MQERAYQARLIKELKRRFPGCLIMKNDSGYLQGIPDLTILYRGRWAMLEVKASASASVEPNQSYYIEYANDQSFGAFIYPENEEEVLDALQHALEPRRAARVSQRQHV